MDSDGKPVIGWDETQRHWYVRLPDGSIVRSQSKTELESFLDLLDERIRHEPHPIRVTLDPGDDSAVSGSRNLPGVVGHLEK